MTPQHPHGAKTLGSAFALGQRVFDIGALSWSELVHRTWRNRRDDMAKKARKRPAAKRARPAGKRDLVRRPKASAYAKRTARGRFKEMDDVGRSQKADKPRKAKKTVRSGYGDQGDERPRTSRRT